MPNREPGWRGGGLAALLALALVAGTPAAAPAQGALERTAHVRLMARIAEPGAQLAPFKTDGCSGGMSEVWTFVSDALPAFARVHGGAPPWEDCCVVHDRAYHDAGGAHDAGASFAARRAADRQLRACVRAAVEGREQALAESYGLGPEAVRTAYDLIAAAMYRAVRAGGGPCSGLPWRWGYGWPNC